MHWAKTLGNSGHVFRPHNRGDKNSTIIGFPYNATKYELSEEKQLWDRIWDEALNHSLANRNSSFTQNIYMQKTRLLHDGDVIAGPVHTHSFTMVMVIASMFLFFTLAITVGVIVFCRKKNMVFALQKSEQEDDGEYEMDDMDTNTDMEDGSDYDEEDTLETSPKKHNGNYSQVNTDLKVLRKQYGEYIQVHNPKSSFRTPVCMDYHKTEKVCYNDETIAGSPAIYKPTRAHRKCDKRGAYQPIDNNLKVETGNDTLASDRGSCPSLVIIPNGAVTSVLEMDNVTCKKSNQQRTNVLDWESSAQAKSFEKVSVISETHNKGQMDSINHQTFHISPASMDQDGINKSSKLEANTPPDKSRSSNGIDVKGGIPFSCDKYDTEISLLPSNVDYLSVTKHNYTDTPVVVLKSKSQCNTSEFKGCDTIKIQNGNYTKHTASNNTNINQGKHSEVNKTAPDEAILNKNMQPSLHKKTTSVNNAPTSVVDINLNATKSKEASVNTHHPLQLKQDFEVDGELHKEHNGEKRRSSQAEMGCDKDNRPANLTVIKQLPKHWVIFEETLD